MKKFNLKAVGESIKNYLIDKYDFVLDKIAINSKAYKNLYNGYNSLLITKSYLPEIENTLNSTQISKVIRQFLNVPGFITKVDSFDRIVIRQSESNDIIVVRDNIEKNIVLQEMRNYTGNGQVFTLEDLQNPSTQIRVPVNRVYVCSSIWLKDLIQLENLFYKLDSSKEVSKI